MASDVKTETPLLSEVSGSGSQLNFNTMNTMMKRPNRKRVTSFGAVKTVSVSGSGSGSGSSDGDVSQLEGSRKRGISVMSKLGVGRRSVLRESDLDITRLREAFSSLDVNGDGLELSEFRTMWKMVFPQRPLDQDAWKTTEKMFSEMDTDGSGIIAFEEIIHYLELHRKRELERSRVPSTPREWVWQYVGNNNVPREWMRDGKGSFAVRCSILTYRLASQVLMVLGVVVIFIESMPGYQNPDGYPGTDVSLLLDIICNVFFTVEFVLWVGSYPFVKSEGASPPREDADSEGSEPPHQPTQRCVNPAVVWQGAFWMEVLALAAFYRRVLDFDHSVPTRSLAVFRMFRIMRVVRAIRSWTKNRIRRTPELGRALKKSFISLVFLMMLLLVVLVITSSVMYFAEQHEASFDFASQQWVRWNDSQYDDSGEPTPYQSIPDAFWWSVVTITTVGYGDQVPVTIPGKVVAGVTMLAGLVVVSFPITILTSTFQTMEADRLDRETRMLECEEFYDGIKRWLETGGVVKRPSMGNLLTPRPLRRESVNPLAGQSPMSSSKVTFNSTQNGDHEAHLAAVVEGSIAKSFVSLEERLGKSLAALESRVASLESELKKQNESQSPCFIRKPSSRFEL